MKEHKDKSHFTAVRDCFVVSGVGGGCLTWKIASGESSGFPATPFFFSHALSRSPGVLIHGVLRYFDTMKYAGMPLAKTRRRLSGRGPFVLRAIEHYEHLPCELLFNVLTSLSYIGYFGSFFEKEYGH
jgi:hypothetical protein